ncbi:phosphate uptake regulator PhoU [Candidatus Woesearchaeota archaeon]|nr:phosphate uptake regulator PhoU [Candidatus Woesearchaeota archaeon]
MKRKIVQHGEATLTVSLPSKWTKKYHLNKGDEVDITERDHELLVSPDSNNSKPVKKVELDIDNIDSSYMLEWLFAALYKKGFDEITLRYKKANPNQIHQLLEDNLMGFTIIEQKQGKSVLKLVAQENPEEFDATLKRIFLVTNSFASNVFEYVKKGDFEHLEDLKFMENSINKLVNFCERILVKKGYSDHQKTCFYYLVAWNLEKVCEYYFYDICKYLRKFGKEQISESVLKVFSEVNAMIMVFYDVFYSFSQEKIIAMDKKQKHLVHKIKSMIREEKLTRNEIIILTALMEITTKLNMSGTTMAINYDFEEVKN